MSKNTLNYLNNITLCQSAFDKYESFKSMDGEEWCVGGSFLTPCILFVGSSRGLSIMCYDVWFERLVKR